MNHQAALGCGEKASKASWERFARCEFYSNDDYLVQVDKYPGHEFKHAEVWQLWVSRHDGSHIRHRQDLIRIKDEIAGREFEAVELFPAESRLTDAANRTSLFVFIELSGNRAPRYPAGPAGMRIGFPGQH